MSSPATTRDSTETPSATKTAERTSIADSPEEATEFRISGDRFEIRRAQTWKSLLVKGVNLGMTKPGRFPGEAAISRAEYDRWIASIAEMHANAIRVYTIHPPAFYRALAAYNESADEPLYLFHGNWLSARLTDGERTAFDANTITAFELSLKNVVDVIHGSTTLPERAGHASGTYDADVSPYTLGFIAGVEWPPRFVARTNEHWNRGTWEGTFFRTKRNAAAFERWLAKRLEFLVSYEVETYDTSRPVSFVNWPTTDPLDHPDEPFVWEDRVSIDPDAVHATADFDAGVFATYHVYPYYPDFINLTDAYTEYTDGKGRANSYAGYLNDLLGATNHPVLIGEYGVPSARGIAHHSAEGLDQGHNTETEQGKENATQFESIVSEGAVGGLVFAWQDEWFKRTWNSAEYTTPGHRPHWLDVQSPEERYGLLSFDPSGGITLSGNESEWRSAEVLYSNQASVRNSYSDGHDSERSLREVRAAADEGFLYLRLTYGEIGARFNWDRMATLVGLDMTPFQGNTKFPRNLQLESDRGMDFVIELRGPERSRVRVASHYDRFYYEYGVKRDWLESVDYATEPDNGRFHPIRLAKSYPQEIPAQNRTLPFTYTETGKLRFGQADPGGPGFDSLTDVHEDSEGGSIELRLPWQLLNVRDPSSRLITGDIWTNSLEAQQRIADIGLMAATYVPDSTGNAIQLSQKSAVADVFPTIEKGHLPADSSARFSWEPWDTPEYDERRKRSYQILRDCYRRRT